MATSSSEASKKKMHILVIPFPAQGHFLPLVHLTHQLLLRGLTITILVTPKNLPFLNSLLSTHSSSYLHTLVFPFPHHHLLSPDVENVKDIGNYGNALIISALSKLKEPVIQWIDDHPDPPVAVLSDSFLGWTHHLGIPRICFHSTNVFMACVFDVLWHNLDQFCAVDGVDFLDLPYQPSIVREHLPSLFRRYIRSDPDWEVVKNGMIVNSSSWGYVVNTFDGLEDKVLEVTRKKIEAHRVFAVGPLSLLGGSDLVGRVGSSSSSHDDIWSWLDKYVDGSVLYVCFGSQKLLKSAQMEALAIGLELSGVKFIWVVKSATAQQLADGYGSLPDGFEDRIRVSDKGLMVRGWAPQVPILNHRAVGGFVSHCGWNSCLEGIVSGAMILGWPMEADQFVNAKLLVDYMGVAIRLCEGEDTVPDPVELGRKFCESMNEELVEKVRAKELKNKALEAVGRGGSSIRDIDGLVKELAQLRSV